MTTDEIGMNRALEAAGITPYETDLADLIVQLAMTNRPTSWCLRSIATRWKFASSSCAPWAGRTRHSPGGYRGGRPNLSA